MYETKWRIPFMITILEKLNSAQRVLRITFGVVPIAAGLDKFFNVLTVWTQYLDPRLTPFLPFSPETFMQIIGIIEIAAGLIVLSRFSTVGAYIVSAWLAVIAVTLIVSGRYLDVAVRDLVMSVSAYTFASLRQVNESVQSGTNLEAQVVSCSS
jgi:uncharacterized membrane protein YphA (DoxX/SURF4 family)